MLQLFLIPFTRTHLTHYYFFFRKNRKQPARKKDESSSDEEVPLIQLNSNKKSKNKRDRSSENSKNTRDLSSENDKNKRKINSEDEFPSTVSFVNLKIQGSSSSFNLFFLLATETRMYS